MVYKLIVFIFIISFSKGALALVGIEEKYTQLGVQIPMLIIVFLAIINILRNRIFVAPGFLIMLLVSLFTFISYLFSDVSPLQFFLYFKSLFIYILFFYALFNVNITKIQKNKLITLLIILYVIQIPAALVKLIILGGTLEKIVGTATISEGSLATVMPLFAISYLISQYLEYKNFKHIVFIILFIFIGLMSNKLGILYYTITLFVLLSYLYARTHFFIPNFKLIKKIAVSSFFSLIIFVLFVTLNPRANPEHKVGGSIDIEYLISFTKDYQTLELEDGPEGDGRFKAPLVAFDRLYNAGITNIILGFGPGELSLSEFTKYKNPLLEKYNIGYGGRLALVWILMQVGLVGLILFIYFHFYFLRKIFKLYKKNTLTSDQNVILLTVIGFSLIFFIDFFTYSSETIHSPTVALTYYFAIYYIFSEFRDELFKNSYFIKVKGGYHKKY